MSTNTPVGFIPVEAELSCNSHHAWVHFPQGLLPWHQDFQRSTEPGPAEVTIHGCRPAMPNREQDELPDAAPFPGLSLFQESFFVCTIRGVADVPGIRDIHVETVVDANCGLAFAKVYPCRNSMNATDILQDRVLPFYARHAISIGKIFTRSTREYCGLAPIHPFETLLSTSRVEHATIDSRWGMRNQPCEDFYRILYGEFFTPAIRSNSYLSFAALQRDLDVFLEKYNHERPSSARSAQKLAPYTLFLEAAGLSTLGQKCRSSDGGG